MYSKSGNQTGIKFRLGLFGLMVVVAYWIIESFIDVYVFQENNLFQRMFYPDTNELWMRWLFVAIIIIFVAYIQSSITKLKRAEAEKLVTLGQVASSVGHDLRNPLTAIRTAAYVLKDDVGEKKQEMLELIDSNVVSAERAIKNLVDFQAHPGLSLGEVDVNALVKEVLSNVVIPKNTRTNLTYGEVPLVKVDAELLKNALLNLVLNALQAMHEGGELTVSTSRSDSMVEIAIKDTGVGISKEDLKSIFKPFFTSKAKGMGLGLPNAQKTVERHGGTLTVESRKNEGTKFTVRLPIRMPGNRKRG